MSQLPSPRASLARRAGRAAKPAGAVALGAVLALGPALAPASAADTNLGAVFVPDVSCSELTIFQPVASGASYRAPSAGVITSWSFTSAGAASVAFKVGQVTGTVLSVKATTAVSQVPPATAFKQSVRIPIASGDLIGIYEKTDQCGKVAPATSTLAYVTGNQGVGRRLAPRPPRRGTRSISPPLSSPTPTATGSATPRRTCARRRRRRRPSAWRRW